MDPEAKLQDEQKGHEFGTFSLKASMKSARSRRISRNH